MKILTRHGGARKKGNTATLQATAVKESTFETVRLLDDVESQPLYKRLALVQQFQPYRLLPSQQWDELYDLKSGLVKYLI